MLLLQLTVNHLLKTCWTTTNPKKFRKNPVPRENLDYAEDFLSGANEIRNNIGKIKILDFFHFYIKNMP